MVHTQKGDTLLLHGAAGGIGTVVTQLTKLASIMVIGLVISEQQMA